MGVLSQNQNYNQSQSQDPVIIDAQRALPAIISQIGNTVYNAVAQDPKAADAVEAALAQCAIAVGHPIIVNQLNSGVATGMDNAQYQNWFNEAWAEICAGIAYDVVLDRGWTINAWKEHSDMLLKFSVPQQAPASQYRTQQQQLYASKYTPPAYQQPVAQQGIAAGRINTMTNRSQPVNSSQHTAAFNTAPKRQLAYGQQPAPVPQQEVRQQVQVIEQVVINAADVKFKAFEYVISDASFNNADDEAAPVVIDGQYDLMATVGGLISSKPTVYSILRSLTLPVNRKLKVSTVEALEAMASAGTVGKIFSILDGLKAESQSTVNSIINILNVICRNKLYYTFDRIPAGISYMESLKDHDEWYKAFESGGISDIGNELDKAVVTAANDMFRNGIELNADIDIVSRWITLSIPEKIMVIPWSTLPIATGNDIDVVKNSDDFSKESLMDVLCQYWLEATDDVVLNSFLLIDGEFNTYRVWKIGTAVGPTAKFAFIHQG